MIIGITDQIFELGPFEREYMPHGLHFKYFQYLNRSLFQDEEIMKVNVLFLWNVNISEYTGSAV